MTTRNLTEVLENEDKSTVETITLGVAYLKAIIDKLSKQKTTITPPTDADYVISADENLYGYFNLADGSWTATHNIILDNIIRSVIIDNSNGTYIATVKTAAGTGIAVGAGEIAILYNDGTNVVEDKRFYSKTQSDALLALKASLTGAIFTGQVKGITPVAAADLTRKDYVDTLLALKASLTYVNTKPTGQKNLLINGDKTHQQRGTTGGRIQVVLNTANLGGVHTISWDTPKTADDTTTTTAVYATTDVIYDTLTTKYYRCILINTVGILLTNVTYFTEITVTIKEATTLGASDAATTWDTALVTGASSGTTVTLTAGKYIHVEFSTTDFDFVQLELGSVATDFEYRHNELELCQRYFESSYSEGYYPTDVTDIGRIFIRAKTTYELNQSFLSFIVKKRAVPSISIYSSATGLVGKYYDITATADVAGASAIDAGSGGFRPRASGGTMTIDNTYAFFYTANAEIFKADDGVGINYKEDRWYV